MSPSGIVTSGSPTNEITNSETYQPTYRSTSSQPTRDDDGCEAGGVFIGVQLSIEISYVASNSTAPTLDDILTMVRVCLLSGCLYSKRHTQCTVLKHSHSIDPLQEKVSYRFTYFSKHFAEEVNLDFLCAPVYRMDYLKNGDFLEAFVDLTCTSKLLIDAVTGSPTFGPSESPFRETGTVSSSFVTVSHILLLCLFPSLILEFPTGSPTFEPSSSATFR